MALMQKLALKQGQSLVMTPQLQQAIKLLQMSTIEIQAFVETELERNPLLERSDLGTEIATREEPAVAAETETSFSDEARGGDGDGADSVTDNVTSAPSDSAAMAPADSSWNSPRSSGQVSLDGEAYDFAANISRDITLYEHLTSQLALHLKDPVDLLIGQYLIGMVNEAGYLTGAVASVAEMLGASEEQVKTVLKVLQGFDPPGVFAADLPDCLRIQLQELNHYDPAMAIMLENLPLVAKRDFQALKNLCAVSLEDVQEMFAELRALNPKPGHAFGAEPVIAVVPDVYVRAAQDGTWQVELNSESLPKVLVNNQYMARVSRGTQKTEDKLFMSECHAQASWLVKSLDQRAKTILKVSREIVKQQDAFLVLGVQHLRPITLKLVADAIEMHESTVSRVTSNKYMSTPRGNFELKYFFTNAIQSASEDGDTHSAESVRHRIKEMIANETADHILSDDEIVDSLKTANIDIARRTIAKYRESLNILSSVGRRREAKSKR
jgi:RNA polymerase sigma-54 factor